MLKNLAGQIAQNEGNLTSCEKVENNFAGARGTRLRVGAFFFRAFARARRGVAIESAWALASSMGARELSRAFARAERRALARVRDRARANPAWLLAEYIAPQARERSAACMLRSQRWLMFRELLWPSMRSCRAALSSWTNARRRGRPLPVVMSVGALHN